MCIYIYIYIYIDESWNTLVVNSKAKTKVNQSSMKYIYIYIYIKPCSTSHKKPMRMIDIVKSFALDYLRSLLHMQISPNLQVLWTPFFSQKMYIIHRYCFNNINHSQVLNCKTYSFFERASSNQRIVSAKIRLSLGRNKKEKFQVSRYDRFSFANSDISNQIYSNCKIQIWSSSGNFGKTFSEWQIWKLCYKPYRSSSQVHNN